MNEEEDYMRSCRVQLQHVLSELRVTQRREVTFMTGDTDSSGVGISRHETPQKLYISILTLIKTSVVLKALNLCFNLFTDVQQYDSSEVFNMGAVTPYCRACQISNRVDIFCLCYSKICLSMHVNMNSTRNKLINIGIK